MPCIAKSFTTTIYKNWHTIACDTILSTIWPSKPLSTYKKPSHSQPFTPHKHMAHHNTIPNSATYIHLHNTHTQKHIHPSYTILLPPPNNSAQWILVILTTWWNSATSCEDQHSPNNSTTYQCAPCHAGFLRISVYLFNGSLFWSNNIFLNDLYHYMLFSISEFPANIYTFITHGLVQASNIHTPLWHMVSPPRFYFFNLEPILCTSVIPVHKPYFFPYMVLNTIITFKTNLSILSNTMAKFISPNRHARKTSTTLVRFLHIL